MTPLHHAFLLKGWLLDKIPPKEVAEAMQEVIDALGQEVVTVAATSLPLPPLPVSVLESEPMAPAEERRLPAEPDVPADEEPQHTLAVATEISPAAPAKKKHNMSPEARAAAAERMRAYQARKRAEKEGAAACEGSSPQAAPSPAPVKPYTPVPYEKLVTDHSGFAGKRDPGQPLTDDDWPDIKARLAKSPDRRAIASDYDVELDDLNFFIASCQRREGKTPGEALASPSSRTSGAIRTPT